MDAVNALPLAVLGLMLQCVGSGATLVVVFRRALPNRKSLGTYLVILGLAVFPTIYCVGLLLVGYALWALFAASCFILGCASAWLGGVQAPPEAAQHSDDTPASMAE